MHEKRGEEIKRGREGVPASLGTALQQPWPWVVTWRRSFSSSSGDQRPLRSFCLGQQECLLIEEGDERESGTRRD